MSKGLEILTFLCFYLVMADAGRVCLSCNGLNDGDFCPRVEKCGDNEVCFTQKYLSNNNEAKVDVGCAYPELCIKDATGQILGRKRDHSHILCHQCCNDTDVCNAHQACEDKPTVPKQVCMSCEAINNPLKCNVTTTCLENEVCYMHKMTINGQSFYDLGCKHSMLCTNGFANSIGRRQASQGTHQICESCCFGTQSCNTELQCNHQSQKPVNGTCLSNTECSHNLICKRGICACRTEDYFSDGQCIERKGEHSNCLHDTECKDPMLCENNYCSCDSGFYWSGSICSNKKPINSQCTSSSECKDSLVCIHGQCVCVLQYDIWNGTHCFPKKNFNDSCVKASECKANLLCREGICQCGTMDYWNGTGCSKKYFECEDINSMTEGVYTIFPGNGQNKCILHDKNGQKMDGKNTHFFPLTYYCKIFVKKTLQYFLEEVIQRRHNGSVDFYRTWQEYKEGFGSAYGEYWLGNNFLHLITSGGSYEITIYMEIANGSSRTANYGEFAVASEAQNYQLTISGYSGDAGYDSMDRVAYTVQANGTPFTTKDRDNDRSSSNCAVDGHSAWWYSDCFYSDFNKRFGYSYWAGWSAYITKSVLAISRR